MSFSDIKYRIETGFIEPLRAFRQKTSALNTIHNDSLTKLDHNIGALLSGADGQTAFQGIAANQLGELLSQFLHNERKLSGQSYDVQGWDLTGRLGDAASKGRQWAVFFETMLDSIQQAPETSTHGIDQAAAGVGTFAGAMDAGAVAQGGVDIPWDIIAGAASGVALGLMLGSALIHAVENSDLERALAATLVLDQAIPKIRQDYETIENDNPLPPELPSPRGPQGDFKTFLAILGIVVVDGAVQLLKHYELVNQADLSPEQLEMAGRLADEYGLNIEDIIRLLEYDPKLSEQDLRKIIAGYLSKKQQYPTIPTGMLLLAVAMKLPDSMLEYMTHLNDGQSNIYLKGSPGDIIADLLASVLGELTQEAKTQLSMLQSAIRKSLNGQTFADQKAKEQAIIEAVDSTGVIWDDLPEAVQNMLLGKIGRDKYRFAYGNSIESLIKQKFEASYPDVQEYYGREFGLKLNEVIVLPDKSKVIPDVKFTEDGQTIIMDITSQKNMPDKKKYLILDVKILIALGY